MSANPVRLERRGAAWPGALKRLLLVDQDTWCRGIADGVLRGRGYRVVCTGDLPSAVQIAREMLPDLVLADVRLSMMEPVPVQERRRTDRAVIEPSPRLSNGYAVLRPLETDPGLASFPVVLLRDPREAGEALDGPRFGVPDYVAKPFTPQTLLEKVEKCLHTVGLTETAGGVAAFSSAPKAPRETELWNPREVVLEGRIDFVGMPAVLEMFHFNQLSGVCAVRSGDQLSAEVGFEDGEIVCASTSDGLAGAEAVFRLLSWNGGRFAFATTPPVRGVPIRARFEQLLLEGLRRLDEQRRYLAAPMESGLLRLRNVPES
jgi:CheY-like chemotaxis protein